MQDDKHDSGFDPYHTWLGIAPQEQPPNHYRLLGIRLWESDQVVIENAADRQMAHLRTFQTGPRSELSQRLLNEVAAAKICLLHPEKKLAYDQMLLSRAVPTVAAKPVPRTAGRGRSGSRTLSAGMVIAAMVVAVAVGIYGVGPAPKGPVAKPPVPPGIPAEGPPEPGPATTPEMPGSEPQPGVPPKELQPTPPPDSEEPGTTLAPGVPPTPPVTPPPPGPPGPSPPGQAPADAPGAGLPTEPKAESSEPPPPTAPPSPAVPSHEAVVKEVDTRYDLGKERTAEERVALAQELLAEARSAPSEEHRQVFRRKAADLACDGGDAALAMEAIDALAMTAEVDGLAEKDKLLAKLAATALSPAQIEAVVLNANDVIDEAIQQDRLEVAESVAEHACLASRRPSAAPFRKGTADRLASVRKLVDRYEPVRLAMATLQTKPEDPRANGLAAGWICLERGDWERGLPYLAKSDNQRLRPLAELEVKSRPSGPQEQVALADRWWDAGYGEKSPAREQIQARAVFWYQAALDRLSGATKKKIEKRLEDHAARVAAQTVAAGEPSRRAPLACRDKRHRAELLAKYGGTAQSEKAVAAALAWIVAQQFPDGGWSFAHQDNPRRKGKPQDPGTEAQARNAATGLALMALLGSGQTHRSGEYKRSIEAGLVFLGSRIQITPAGGSFHEQGGTMYSHGIATIALCEAYAMTHDPRLRAPAQQAIRFICNAQHAQGGWRYQPQTPGDTSVLGWQLAALRAGYLGGIAVPAVVTQKAVGYLDQVQADDGSRYGYQQPEANNVSMTTVGLLCRMQLGWKRGNPALAKGVEWLGRVGPDPANFYRDYYATQLMFHYGGQAWESWNPLMRDQLLGTQATDGQEPGSWYSPGSQFNRAGGRLCCTALATLILQTYYRYPPLEAK